MATRNVPVAIATILSGLLVPLTINTGILGLLPDWITDQHLYIFSMLSICAGLFQLDPKFQKYSILFNFPTLIWALFSINLIQINNFMLPFANYFGLWLLTTIYLYQDIYGRKFYMKFHRWVGIQILIASGAISIGNDEIGALNDFISRTNIDTVAFGFGLGLFGILLLSKKDIRLTRTVLFIAFPIIVHDLYIVLYIIFIGTSKALLPLLLLKVYITGRGAERYYDAF